MVSQAPQSATRKWLAIAGASAAILGLAFAFLGYALAPKLREMARQRLQEYLKTHFAGSVEFSSLRVDLFPRVHGVVDGLVIRHKGRTDIPPLIEVREASFDADILTLLGTRHEVSKVRLDGLVIHIPPRIPGGPPLIHRSNADLAEKYPIVLDEIDAPEALLVLLRKPSDAAKPPNEFEIHELVINGFRFDRPAAFHALLTNPKPHGLIHCDGAFGPWVGEDPGETPASGEFTFRDADLGTLKGISGILSSEGKFSGPLDYLQVEGTTDTPDFALRTTAHPMALHTDYTAIVDGTNGDTILQNVTAKFLHTTLVTHGSVVDVYPRVKGRTVVLDAISNDARVEDLLFLALKSDKPIMTGSAQLKARILIPEGNEDLIQRLQLDGQFGLGAIHFTSAAVQGKVDSLSRRGQGKPEDVDISGQVSDLRGHFTMGNDEIHFPSLQFGVEGADIALAGTYNMDSGQLDFHGKLRLRAELSQTMTGWKSALLKPFDHFFRGKNAGVGTQIPIKITGTRENPSFGSDFGDKANTQ
jgi:AsmA-like C-terminal region